MPRNCETLLAAHNEGVFTPSSHLRNHIQIPGAFGGSNWGAAAADPTSGMMFVRAYDAPSIRQLRERSATPRSRGGPLEQRGLAVYTQLCVGCHLTTRTEIMHGLADKGITHTGSYRPRTGPVVTAGGLIFQATGGDHTLRAYDKDDGKVLWEKQLEANPDGIPAVYQVGGRQYVVFYAAGDEGGGSRRGMNFKPGKRKAQGYYAFALPR